MPATCSPCGTSAVLPMLQSHRSAPLDVAQYGEEEFRAAVESAENWGRYVGVPANTPRAIQAAIKAGVRVIDHGQLMDEATAKLMAERGVWLSMQPFLDDEDSIPFPEGSANRAKQLEMTRGTDSAYALAKKSRLETAWGTKTLFDAKLATRQGEQLDGALVHAGRDTTDEFDQRFVGFLVCVRGGRSTFTLCPVPATPRDGSCPPRQRWCVRPRDLRNRRTPPPAPVLPRFCAAAAATARRTDRRVH